MTDSRYIIGIDLGTTNSTIAFVDTHVENPVSESLTIPQIIAPGEISKENHLPSFLYLPEQGTYKEDSFNLPWDIVNQDLNVGIYAQKLASTSPGKVVSSAKSWLCADNVDRLSDFLPAQSQDSRKISPVSACSAYLKHLAETWNLQMASQDKSNKIKNQQIVLTVPASFDTVARELTVLAAEEAGLQVTLLEEPQSAFYAWIHDQSDNWRQKVVPGTTIVVCDIGGGTSDFSLIGVEDNSGSLELKRLAVGKHILLGGDNMDITLAYAIQQKLGQRLNSKQMASLIHVCRSAKEKLCNDPSIESEKITILGSGSSLIGGSISSSLSRNEIDKLIFEAFTPECEFGTSSIKNSASGLRTFGLKYEYDTAITRHLSEFLATHCPKDEHGKTQLPDAILFNGGVSKAHLLRKRICHLLSTWAGREVRVLNGNDPDLAVSRGAAWYGFVRRGNAIRIKSGSPHSYYIGMENSMPAVPGFPPPMDAICIVPFGTENGTNYDVPIAKLGLLVGETCHFNLYYSNSRPDDMLGDVFDDLTIPQLTPLPTMTTTLVSDNDTSGHVVSVKLKAELTEVGTLKLWFYEINQDRQWRLEFDLANSTSQNHSLTDQSDDQN